jgi:GNAT superfamily N-acetyltransferase
MCKPQSSRVAERRKRQLSHRALNRRSQRHQKETEALARLPRTAVCSLRMAKKAAKQNLEPRLIDVNPANFDTLPCCGIKDPAHPGRREKLRWLAANAKFGLRAKALLAPDGQPSGYIEYIPGEFAWRGVNAGGYMFIHCVWIYSKKHERKGWGRLLVESCLDDAKRSGKNGVAVMVRNGPWLADKRLFVANGFEPVATAPPDYELLVRKFRNTAPNPTFEGDWNRKLERYSRGLTIIRSSQCPHIAKFASEIIEAAKNEYGIEPKVIDVHTASDAQHAPTPYAVFALIRDGQVLADHQISRTRFRNIMRACEGRQGRS